MDKVELIAKIFEICIFPLLAILTKFIADYLTAKKGELVTKTDNEILNKYLEMAIETVKKCVVTTNQTYVNALKEQGQFDAAAQKEAFTRTMASVLAVLTDEVKTYLNEATGDLNTYLTQLIESEVYYNKQE